MSVDGILNINKPPGMTSFGVVKLARRLSQQKSVGHAGTLDPMATGVLVVCLGQATRVIPFMMDTEKTYLAVLELGVSTDTYDADGEVTQRLDSSGISRERVEQVLPSFVGTILQKPPMYSAVKHQGKRLYELARSGTEVEREPRSTHIFRLELVDWQPPLCTIVVECGKGTYVRALAHDLGQFLGCGAHIRGLVRLSSGPFSIDDSLTITELEAAVAGGYWQELLYPMDVALGKLMAVVVSEEQERAIGHGQMLEMSSVEDCAYCRAYSLDGRFLAVLRFLPDRGLWHPDKVFAGA